MVAVTKRRLNVYTCQSCGNRIVTEDVDEGVTPFMINCDKCRESEAYSCFYQCSSDLTPKYEWFKPKNDEEIRQQIAWELETFHPKNTEATLAENGITLEKIFSETKCHVAKGGLLIRSCKRTKSEKL